MRHWWRWAVAIFGVVSLAGGAAAQFGRRGPDFHGVWNPVVGSGGVYEVSPKQGDKSKMEIAVVGKEDVEGKTGYWLEMVMNSPRADGEIVVKHLIVLDGDRTEVKRMIMQPPGQDPMEMPMQMIQRQGRGSQQADVRKDAELVGTESLTTPAGTFSCDHYRMKDGSADVWVSAKVIPYGLVKSVAGETTMTLIRVVTDAKDRITGTPRPFNPMDMRRQPPN
jgi:hypothetical protein